jgi:PAS domain S-box-containing protein
VLVFVLVIFIAFTLAAMRYFREYTHFYQQAQTTMQQQADGLNTKLSHSVQALTGLVEFANYCLKYPDNTEKLLPEFAQDGEYFYLIKPKRDIFDQRSQLSGNITGIGNIKQFDSAIKQELAMANALTPAFVTAKHTNPEITWFYYISKRRFVHLFPWVSRQSWRYSDQLIKRNYFTEIQKNDFTGQFYWSPPYQDSAGKGLTASIATRVTQKKQFVGALVIDINLNSLRHSLPEIEETNQGYILLDHNQHVLIHKTFNKADKSHHNTDDKSYKQKITATTTWQDITPDVLKNLSAQQLAKLSETQRIDDWFIQKEILPINGWVLIKYQPYNDFIAPLAGQFLFWFFMLFFGLVAFIVLIYWLTNKTFIKPATEFIQHIEHCARGDSGKIKPTPDWRHWFYVVEDIFSQNRSLMQQLKDRNIELDKRVKAKTADLQKTSEQHQRDYALLRSVMNAMPELIVFTDPQGKLIGCNSALEKFIAQKETNILGKTACSLFPTEMSDALALLSSKAYKDENRKSYQQVIKTSTHTFELFSRRFFDENNKALGTINVFHDVTDVYRTQAALEQAKNQAEQANKTKGQFLANMSHEIRTPINAIQGMMYLLTKTPLNKAQQQYLTNAKTASQSLLYLIDELLDLAKIEAGKMPILMAETYIDEIIDKALKLNIGVAHNKALTVTIDIAANVPQSIVSDEIRLVQVLTNLLNNAIKFTAKGEVNLRVELANVNNITDTTTTETTTTVLFRVIDTGIGIAKEKQAQLFNAFTQADESMTRKYGGSGLGLSICQQIVKLLGGEIELTSELGRGSEFSFTVPSKVINKSKNSLKQLKVLSVIAYKTQLPTSLIAKLEEHNWQYIFCADQAELQHTGKMDNSFVLVEANTLLAQPSLVEMITTQFSYLGVCLPMLSELDGQLNQQLEALNIPWGIIEQPYYRAIIKQIMTITEQVVTAQKSAISHPLQEVESNTDNLAGVNVLLVEDNLVNQLVAQELLKSMNANVVIANNGQEAFDLLAKNALNKQYTIDVVLMDIQMPIMDGLTATKKIRAMTAYQSLPIIAMTAHAREENQQQSFAAGMNKHIAKPVTYQTLLAAIKAVI